MSRDLPNLDWLRVFSATAATESFALAALRLGVTPGAVSQRIKALEAFLGVSLFQRYPQGVKLTEAGKRYAQRVRPSLEQLTLATQEITSTQTARAVRLTILPALAQLWLGSRMDLFHKLHTNATVEIWADPVVIISAPRISTWRSVMADRHFPAANIVSCSSTNSFPWRARR